MVIAAISLLPWIMLSVTKLTQEKSYLWTGIFLFALSEQIFCSFPQAVFITLLFAGSYLLFQTVSHNACTRTWTLFCLACVTAFALGAVQLLPSWEYHARTTVANGFSPTDASYFSYPPKHLMTFLSPYLLGNPKKGTYPDFKTFDGSIFWENSSYIGIVPVFVSIAFLAFLLFFPKKLKGVPVFLLLAMAGSFLLMTGSHSPLYFIYSLWPYSVFRTPSRFLWIFTISLALLSAFGAEAFLKKRNHLFIHCLMGILFLANIVNLFAVWHPYHALGDASDWLKPPESITSDIVGNRVYSFGQKELYTKEFTSHGWIREKPYLFLENALIANSSALWHIQNLDIYSGISLARRNVILSNILFSVNEETAVATPDALTKKLLSLENVGTVITPYTLDDAQFTQEKTLVSETATLTMYRNETVQPRVYLASSYGVETTVERALTYISSDSFILGTSVLLEENPPTPQLAGGGTITNFKDTESNVRMDVDTPNGPTFLVLSDTSYPGWHASVDGKETKIFAANINSRAVLVPKGKHTVVFLYNPASIRLGMWISILTIVFIIVAGIVRTLWSAHHRNRTIVSPSKSRPRNHDRS
jgi:hypothetical protein